MDAEAYVDMLFPEDAGLLAIRERIREQGMPEISIAAGYGRLLTLLVQMSSARQALEIGALGGYSGTCIARGLPMNGQLLCLEVNPAYAEIAKKHMKTAGLGDKVTFRVGDATGSLLALINEKQSFDFFFIDADKAGYPKYLELTLKLSNPGAIIVADNTLLHGRTSDANIQDADAPSVKAMRFFNKTVAEHPRLDSVILPAYDGLAIARVKEE